MDVSDLAEADSGLAATWVPWLVHHLGLPWARRWDSELDLRSDFSRVLPMDLATVPQMASEKVHRLVFQ